MNTPLLIGLVLAIFGHTGVWFSLNSQLVWEWWSDKPIFANIVFGVPAGVSFWYATKYLMGATDELWSVRFLMFAASYFIFPVLTYAFLDESPFTIKTILCTALALVMIAVQVLIKN